METGVVMFGKLIFKLCWFYCLFDAAHEKKSHNVGLLDS